MQSEIASGVVRVFSVLDSTVDTRSRVSLRCFWLNVTFFLREDGLPHAGRRASVPLLTAQFLCVLTGGYGLLKGANSWSSFFGYGTESGMDY